MPVPVADLQDVPLFAGLSTVELEQIASELVDQHVKVGEIIMKEGDAPDHPIYILLGGSVDVIKRGFDGKEHIITCLAAPSVFGEIEVLARRPAIARVTAGSDAHMALLHRGVFDQLCESGSTGVLKIVHNLAVTLACRLASTDGLLATYFSKNAGQDSTLGKVRSELYAAWK